MDDISRFDPNNEKSLQVVSVVDDEKSLNLKGDPTNNNALYTNATVSSSTLPTGASTSAKQLADDHNVTVSNMIPDVETGLATSAKQLADNHQVTVSNPTADPEIGLAKDATLTDGTQVTKLKETVPTDALNNNGSGVLAYDENGDLSTITKTIGAVSYIKTLTYTARVLTGISVWSIV